MKSVVINASGGGTDTGSQGNGLVEKNVTLEISNIIKNILESKGVDVYMLRNSDKTISYDERIKDLKNKYPNGKNVIVLSNTLGSGATGIDIIYSLSNKDTLASKIANNIDYFNDANYYQLRYPSDTTKDYYYIMRNTPGYETIIVKYGNVDNAVDANIIKDNVEELASAVADALLDYIGVSDLDYYEVKKGDTLYDIANKFSTTVNEIKKINNLASSSLAVGQKLKIPEYVENPSIDEIGAEYYIVQKGDSLYKIANKYNTTVEKLKEINNLSSNLLSIGQKLKITSNINSGKNTYIVQKGDTLYAIASKFNMTVEQLKKINSLTSNSLSIGQKLIVDGNTNTYTVKKGDTLYGIANKNNTTVNKIKEINNLNSNSLSIGQTLYLP